MTNPDHIHVTRSRDTLNRGTRFTFVVPDEALLGDVPMRFIDKLRSAWKELIEDTTPTPTGEEADDG